MKSKYLFAFVLILTILFSLGTIAASEDMGYNANSSDDTYLSIDNQCSGSNEDGNVQLSFEDDSDEANANQNVLIGDASTSNDQVDLSVDMELDLKKDTQGIGEMSFEGPFIITAKSSGGTAKDVKVYLNISDEFEFVSKELNIGAYNPDTGIWDIGDLQSNVNATLKVFTKITTKGTYIASVNATTTSDDVNLSNNDLTCNIKVDSKITSNTTRTSAEQNGAQHNSHYGSTPGERDNENGQQTDQNQSPGEGDGTSSGSGDNSGGDSASGGGSSGDGASSGSGDNSRGGSSGDGASSGSGDNSGSGSKGGAGSNSEDDASSDSGNSALKNVDSNIFASATKSIGDTISDILNPDSDSNSNDEVSGNSKGAVKAIDTYDYTQIPILIFALFLVTLIGMFAYDRIKS